MAHPPERTPQAAARPVVRIHPPRTRLAEAARRASPIPRMDPVRHRSELYEDPLQFLWAISYSDLLMVLMSFFIIFFEMNTTPPPSVVARDVLLAVKDSLPLQADPHASSSAGAGAGTGAGAGAVASVDTGASMRRAAVLDSLGKTLSNEGLASSKRVDPETLTVELPDNIYKPGQYALSGSAASDLRRALDAIRSHAGEIRLTFVGHTDATPIGPTGRAHRGLIDSNLVLSNLRATRAAELALTLGFDPRHVVSEGTGEHSRNTRSLSLRITARTLP